VKFHKLAAYLSLGVSLCALTQTAQAQAGASQDRGLTEIIVRAQRVEQSLQKVPVAVTPVSAKELENKNLRDVAQLALAVPSLGLSTDNSVTLRGIGSEIFSSNVDSSVGVMLDNVSLGVPIFMSNGSFVDMEQVEALTGPQGLLFGRNASAGLVNISTRKPKIGATEGSVSLEYDNRNAPGGHFGIEATGVLNLPTSANSALRLNGLIVQQDPIVKALVNTSKDYQAKHKNLMGKAKWLWESGDTSVYLIGDYSRERGLGGVWDHTYRQTGSGPTAADINFAAADGVKPGPTNLYAGVSGRALRSVDTGGISATISHKLSDHFRLTNILGWRHYTLNQNYDSDLSSAHALDINSSHQSYNQYSNELRLAYTGGKLDGQVGLFGFWSSNDVQNQFQGGGPFASAGISNFVDGYNAYHLTGRSLAAYSQFNYHASDKFTLIAGGRVTNDRSNVRATVTNSPRVNYSPPLFGFLDHTPFV
jgi:iron complex outermembrane receptor protein